MSRVTAEQVQAIIEVDTTSITDFTPFITAASALVTKFCSATDYDEDYLLEIERWLAAHFCAIRDMRPASESAGPVSVSYQFKVGMALENTMYGQQAMLLDYMGGLSRWSRQVQEGKRAAATLFWLGTPANTTEDVVE